MSRYDIHGAQNSTEPGSSGRVMANRQGLKDQASLNEAEAELLLKLYEEVFGSLRRSQPLSTSLLKCWHYRWLGNLYDWAGEERQVNLQKDGFPFAPAARLPGLLNELDKKWLKPLTPCQDMGHEAAIHAIAQVHVELILIHPFREGSGRIARLLADAMAYQAGLPLLDYDSWRTDKSAYIQAIHAGMAGDYAPMTACIRQAVET